MTRISLSNKNILLISPQKWGEMHLSKHHYAIELAKRGNTVYFLNPFDINQKKRFIIKQHEEYKELYIVTYKPLFPLVIRFHFRWLFDFLMQFQVKMLLLRIGRKIDIVWCFEPNLYSNLNLFKADLNIFHPVDQLNYDYQFNIASSAHVVFSVSDVILNRLKTRKVQQYFINHGLSEHFEEQCRNGMIKKTPAGQMVKIGYAGNLFMGHLDRNVMKSIIVENPDVSFFFWGPYRLEDSYVSGYVTDEIRAFIRFLSDSKNVTLKGVKQPKELADEICDIDGFLVCIDPEADPNKGSNSHKILEYLSTGKVVISNYISSYSDKRDLIAMVDENSNSKLPDLFKKVISNLSSYNSIEFQKKRIEFALDNTYAKQIDRIETYL